MRVLLSVLVGVATFLVVAVAVTSLLRDVVWPSVFVGVPAGVIVGAAAAIGTGLYLNRREQHQQQ